MQVESFNFLLDPVGRCDFVPHFLVVLIYVLQMEVLVILSVAIGPEIRVSALACRTISLC